MSGWLPRLFGQKGERVAARFLKRQGYRILTRHYSNHFGEIDLIALDGSTIVFVEVKSRRSDVAGDPVEAVTPKKQGHLTRTALAYLKRFDLLEEPSRFDVVTLLWPKHSRRPDIRHYKNAFEAVGRGQMYS
jgi:putative endonuclease